MCLLTTLALKRLCTSLDTSSSSRRSAALASSPPFWAEGGSGAACAPEAGAGSGAGAWGMKRIRLQGYPWALAARSSPARWESSRGEKEMVSSSPSSRPCEPLRYP